VIDRARASPPVRPVATGRDDAPMKSVCPVGTRVPDDAAGAGNWIDHHVSPRAEKAPLHHARAHIRVPAHLAFSLVGLSVTGAGPGHFAFGSTGADHGLGPSANSSTRGSPRSVRFSSYFWIAIRRDLVTARPLNWGTNPSCDDYDPPRTCKARSVLRKVTAHSFQARCSTPVAVWARWGQRHQGLGNSADDPDWSPTTPPYLR